VPYASTCPAAIAGLLSLFQTISLDGEVRDGPDVGDSSAREVITVGYVGPDDDTAAEAAEVRGDMGGARDKESYDIHCATAVLIGDEGTAGARVRAFALLGQCGDWLRRSRNLGGAVMSARISTWTLRDDSTTGGAYCRIRFDVHVEAFTAPI
jgi:hypothetical protein